MFMVVAQDNELVQSHENVGPEPGEHAQHQKNYPNYLENVQRVPKRSLTANRNCSLINFRLKPELFPPIVGYFDLPPHSNQLPPHNIFNEVKIDSPRNYQQRVLVNLTRNQGQRQVQKYNSALEENVKKSYDGMRRSAAHFWHARLGGLFVEFVYYAVLSGGGRDLLLALFGQKHFRIFLGLHRYLIISRKSNKSNPTPLLTRKIN